METKSKDTFDKYKAIVTRVLNATLVPEEDFPHEEDDFLYKRIIDDLGADSLDAVEIIMNIEENIVDGIPDDKAEKAETVLDLIMLAMEFDGVSKEDMETIWQTYAPTRSVRRSLKQPRDPSKTDWSKADAKTDEDIAADVASDPDAAPLLKEGETLLKPATPRRMSQSTMDQITDEATHAALTVLKSAGIYVNSMQTDALNDSITTIVRGDNETRNED